MLEPPRWWVYVQNQLVNWNKIFVCYKGFTRYKNQLLLCKMLKDGSVWEPDLCLPFTNGKVGEIAAQLAAAADFVTFHHRPYVRNLGG